MAPVTVQQKTSTPATRYHKDGLVWYCNTKTNLNGVNNKSIQKN